MSVVTNFILTFGCGETEVESDKHDSMHRLVQRINDNADLRIYFTRVDHLTQGSKYMEAAVYIAAGNYVDTQAIIDAIKAQPWQSPEDVVLLLKEQGDDRFSYHLLLDTVELPPDPITDDVETTDKYLDHWKQAVGSVRGIKGRPFRVTGVQENALGAGRHRITLERA